MRERKRTVHALILSAAFLCASAGGAQVLIDRVLARVDGAPVTLSDVRAALAMGLIVAGRNEMALATEQWVQRQLLLAEVERFPPPEPPTATIDPEVDRIRIASDNHLRRLRQRLDSMSA